MPSQKYKLHGDSHEEDRQLLELCDQNASKEDGEHNSDTCFYHSQKTLSTHRTRCFAHPFLPLLVTFFLALFTLGCFVTFHALKGFEDPSGLSDYFHLAEYTTALLLEGDERSGEGTLEASQFWEQILDTDGVVAIPHMWAQQHGLPTSEPHPERPDHGLYQIDLWHSLHCLFRIRNRITSHLPVDEHPRDDAHTLHCLDYLRQQLMCHADITLQEALSDRKVVNQCQDFGVVQGWVRDHGWPGYRAYMWPIMAAEAEAAANRSMSAA